MTHRTSKVALLMALLLAAACRPESDSRRVEAEPVRAVSGPAEPHTWAAPDVGSHEPLTPALSPAGGEGGRLTPTPTPTPTPTATATATPDLTPPTVPASLAAEALGETEIALRWSSSTDEVAVLGYEVVREGRVVAGASGPNARDQGLKPALRHCYQVRAYDAAGNRSALSSKACAETPDLTPPTPPLHMVARATSDRSIDLGWQASADNVGVARYQVLREGELIAEPPGTSFEAQDLRPGVRYCYTVRALDAAGNTSPSSASACAVTPDVTPPTIPEAIAAQPVSPSSIYLGWRASEDDVGVAGYEVLDDDGVLLRVIGTDAYTASLTAGARHCFRVRAFDRAGNRSRPSRPTCSLTASDEQPPAPYRLRAEPASERAVNLTWEPSSRPGVVYRVYWENDRTIGATRLTAFGAVGLEPGEHHCYRVAAVDETGQESSRTLEACAAPRNQSLSSR